MTNWFSLSQAHHIWQAGPFIQLKTLGKKNCKVCFSPNPASWASSSNAINPASPASSFAYALLCQLVINVAIYSG